jgi:hypothetical protein
MMDSLKTQVGFNIALMVGAGLSAGCGLPPRVLPADDAAASKVKSELEASGSFVVNERFIVLPVGWEDSKEYQGQFSFGSLAFQASAWSQSKFGLSPSSLQVSRSVLNLIVVDLDTGTRKRIFDRHVAAWVHPFTYNEQEDADSGLCSCCGRTRQQKTVLRYPGLLALIARTQDTNADKQIDDRDSEWLFVYDVPGGKLKRVSPQGYRVEYMSLLKDTILAFMAPETAPLGDTSKLAIYKYDPRTDRGDLIKDIE